MNELTASRSLADDRPRHRPAAGRSNLSDSERLISMVAGGALIAAGLWRRLPGGLLAPLTGAALVHRAWTGHCAVYGLLGVNSAQGRSRHLGVPAGHGRKVTWSVHIERDPRELYDFWRKLENLPRVMRHLDSVTPEDEQRSHWVARGPFGRTLEWDAEIITDRPGETIGWRSLPGSQVDTAGSVHFRRPSFGEGTELVVSLKYDPPGGRLVAAVADFVGQGLEETVDEDLRAFKQLMEAGEVSTAALKPAESERAEA